MNKHSIYDDIIVKRLLLEMPHIEAEPGLNFDMRVEDYIGNIETFKKHIETVLKLAKDKKLAMHNLVTNALLNAVAAKYFDLTKDAFEKLVHQIGNTLK
jgi:hypothetical protein